MNVCMYVCMYVCHLCMSSMYDCNMNALIFTIYNANVYINWMGIIPDYVQMASLSLFLATLCSLSDKHFTRMPTYDAI